MFPEGQLHSAIRHGACSAWGTVEAGKLMWRCSRGLLEADSLGSNPRSQTTLLTMGKLANFKMRILITLNIIGFMFVLPCRLDHMLDIR